MHTARTTLLGMLFILAACQEPGQPRNAIPRVALGECPVPNLPAAMAIAADSRCGILEVAEDPARPDGRRIPLKIMVIPSISPRPSPDPIFFLAGGPGQAATEVGAMMFSALPSLRRKREVVLVDQRGTGASSPLDCKLEPAPLDVEISLQQLNELQLRLVRECLADIESGEAATANSTDAEGPDPGTPDPGRPDPGRPDPGRPDPGRPDPGRPDPRFYTTPIAMDDLDAVRDALGYDRINLIGGSYGTRAALVYLRRHPEHVRSVVLDAVVPLTMRIPYTMGTDAARAFERLLGDCERDPGCAASFPDLRAHLTELIERLNRQPATVKIADPHTGDETTATLFGESIVMLARATLYSSELSALLPLAIESAWNEDYQPLVTLASFFDSAASGMSTGMMLSVLCSEDVGASPQVQAPAVEPPVFDFSYSSKIELACTAWPKGAIADDYFTPVRSDAPVLLLSGALDPVTPPRWGDEALRTLGHARHIIVPGAGHGTMTYPCVRRMIETFLDNPAPEELADDCLAHIRRPAFFYNKAGPVRQDENDPG